jgi:CheY-like chemotaxis protein
MKFSIKDNGIGINKENLHRIFLPFEQESSKTAKIFVGTGLGLAISYSLVKMMGGTLQVESRVNKGSEFFFSIPFIKVNTDNIEKNQVIIDYTKFVGKRILLVEDNELNADITKSILENMGLIVDVASDGASAIKKYNEAKTDFYQVILMDIRMPGIDGISATKIIRNLGKPNSKTIPIIAMTANTFLDEDKEVLKLGMNSYLAKPIDITKLYLELSKYI